MVTKKKKKERTKENNEREANGSRREEEKKEQKRRRKKREKKGEFFEVEQKGEPVKRKENPPQCLVWFAVKWFGLIPKRPKQPHTQLVH